MYNEVLNSTISNSKISKFKYYKFINSYFGKSDKSILKDLPLDHIISLFNNPNSYANYIKHSNDDLNILPLIFRYSLNYLLKFTYYSSIEQTRNVIIRKYKDLTISKNMFDNKEIYIFIYHFENKFEGNEFIYDYIISNYFFKENLYDKTFILDENDNVIGFYIQKVSNGKFIFELYSELNLISKIILMINFFFLMYFYKNSNFNFYDFDIRTLYIIENESEMEDNMKIISKKVNLVENKNNYNTKEHVALLIKFFIVMFETEENSFDSYADNFCHYKSIIKCEKDEINEIMTNIFINKFNLEKEETEDIRQFFSGLIKNIQNESYEHSNKEVNQFLFFISKSYLLFKEKNQNGQPIIRSSYLKYVSTIATNQICNQQKIKDNFNSNQFNSNNIIVYASSFKYLSICSKQITYSYERKGEQEIVKGKYGLDDNCQNLFEYDSLIKKINDLFKEALNQFKNEQYDNAISVLNIILPKVQKLLIGFDISNEKDDDVIKEYNTMKKLEFNIYYSLALCYEALENYQQSDEWFIKANLITNGDISFKMSLISHLINTNKVNEALELIKPLNNMDKENQIMHNILFGRINLSLTKIDKAENYLNDACSLMDSTNESEIFLNITILYYMAQCLMKKNLNGKTLKLLNEIIDIYNKYPNIKKGNILYKVYESIGDIYYSNKQYEESSNYYQNSVNNCLNKSNALYKKLLFSLIQNKKYENIISNLELIPNIKTTIQMLFDILSQINKEVENKEINCIKLKIFEKLEIIYKNEKNIEEVNKYEHLKKKYLN